MNGEGWEAGCERVCREEDRRVGGCSGRGWVADCFRADGLVEVLQKVAMGELCGHGWV